MIDNESPEDRNLLQNLLHIAVEKVHPAHCLARHLPEQPGTGRIVVVGAGKAAPAMALALERQWPRAPLSGLVIGPYGSSLPTAKIDIVEAAHPVPDHNSVASAERILRIVRDTRPDDFLIALISGGGSSLMALPIHGLTLEEKQSITRSLMSAGAPIHEINLVRKHLSAVKGGKLLAASRAGEVLTLAISDVAGDVPATIASGPTVPESSSPAHAIDLLYRYGLTPPPALLHYGNHITAPEKGSRRSAKYKLIARPIDALTAAADAAREMNFAAGILNDRMEGRAADIADHLARLARDRRAGGQSEILLSGGEAVTKLDTPGAPVEGGPNRECALAFALAIEGDRQISALMADTDGVDGQTRQDDPIAGAFVDGWTVERGRHMGLDASEYLQRHASGAFFEAIGQSVRIGNTQTNVNDFRAVLVKRL